MHIDVADSMHIISVNSVGEVFLWIESTSSWQHIDTPFLKMISISSDNKIAGIDS